MLGLSNAKAHIFSICNKWKALMSPNEAVEPGLFKSDLAQGSQVVELKSSHVLFNEIFKATFYFVIFKLKYVNF